MLMLTLSQEEEGAVQKREYAGSCSKPQGMHTQCHAVLVSKQAKPSFETQQPNFETQETKNPGILPKTASFETQAAGPKPHRKTRVGTQVRVTKSSPVGPKNSQLGQNKCQ